MTKDKALKVAKAMCEQNKHGMLVIYKLKNGQYMTGKIGPQTLGRPFQFVVDVAVNGFRGPMV